jgi:hypothetical protein
MPFERARRLLVKGVTERRVRRRAAARQALEEAAGEFDRMVRNFGPSEHEPSSNASVGAGRQGRANSRRPSAV